MIEELTFKEQLDRSSFNVILAAKAGCGKTNALAFKAVSEADGGRVAFVSLECPYKMIDMKLNAQLAAIKSMEEYRGTIFTCRDTHDVDIFIPSSGYSWENIVEALGGKTYDSIFIDCPEMITDIQNVNSVDVGGAEIKTAIPLYDGNIFKHKGNE